MKALRFGLIGGGRWAALQRDAVRAAGHTLSHVCVRSEAHKEALQAQWGVPVTTRLETLLSAPAHGGAVDAVIIASPNDLHAQHAVACLHAGKHVLVEKPMALTVGDCEGMQRAAEKAARLLIPSMQMRLFGHYAALQALLPDLGPLRFASLHLWRSPHGGGPHTWRADTARRGTLWLEEPIHYLDLLGFWFGGPPGRLRAWEPAPGVMQARLRWAQGGEASFEYSLRGSGHAVLARVIGEEAAAELRWEGSADLDPRPRVRLVRIRRGEEQTLAVPAACGHAHDGPKLVAAFAQACDGVRSPALPTAVDGENAVSWSLAAARSCEDGHAVDIGICDRRAPPAWQGVPW